MNLARPQLKIFSISIVKGFLNVLPKHTGRGEKEKVSHVVVSDVLLRISWVYIVLRRLHFVWLCIALHYFRLFCFVALCFHRLA